MIRKNIGLLTLDSRSYNYGGLLQEYALQQTIIALGYECEVLDYDHNSEYGMFSYRRSLRYLTPTKIVNRLNKKKKQNCTKTEEIAAIINSRHKRFDDFRKEYMSFSARLNDLSSLHYDGYVCGSDQIWNPEQSRPSFFLDFVGDMNRKTIYAASISRNKLTKEEKRVYKDYLSRLKNVSVRETRAKELIKEIVGGSSLNGKEVEVVLDPTLLIDKTHWIKIAESEPLIKDKYIFCYFLGIDDAKIKAAKNFAKEMKIISLPYLLGVYNSLDDGFSKDPFPVGPKEFLNLILHAEYILTDSFHASIFSIIFNKKFRVFGRNSCENNMNSRLETLLGYIDHGEYLIDTDKLESSGIEKTDHYDFSKIERSKKMSIMWLRDSIRGQ